MSPEVGIDEQGRVCGFDPRYLILKGVSMRFSRAREQEQAFPSPPGGGQPGMTLLDWFAGTYQLTPFELRAADSSIDREAREAYIAETKFRHGRAMVRTRASLDDSSKEVV